MLIANHSSKIHAWLGDSFLCFSLYQWVVVRSQVYCCLVRLSTLSMKLVKWGSRGDAHTRTGEQIVVDYLQMGNYKWAQCKKQRSTSLPAYPRFQEQVAPASGIYASITGYIAYFPICEQIWEKKKASWQRMKPARSVMNIRHRM